jgi:hypothetical protein
VLLGIAFLGLLAFLLYHYRLKSLEGRFEFRKVLYWSEWGKCVSASQSMLVVGVTMASASPHFMMGHMMISRELLFPFNLLWEANIFMYGNLLSVVFFASIIFLPLLFASLIQWKIISPFDRGRVTSKRTFDNLFKTGMLLVLFVGALCVGMAFRSGAADQLYTFIFTILPLALGLFIGGILAVGKASRNHPRS